MLGLDRVKQILPKMREDENIDFVIANGENTAEGMGISEKTFEQLNKLDIDVITLGNHTWAKRDIFKIIDEKNVLRPANYSDGVMRKRF